MNMQIYTITQAQFVELLPALPDADRDTMLSAARVSEVLLVGMYQAQPLAFLGFVPVTLASDSAYMWLWISPAGQSHSILLARCSPEVIRSALDRWPILIGNCLTRQAVQWLSWLGADFLPSGQFELRRAT